MVTVLPDSIRALTWPSNSQPLCAWISISTDTGAGITTEFYDLSASHSREADQLAESFEKNVIKSLEGLADPYGSALGTDPFEYFSVPHGQTQTAHASITWTGRILPIPIDDD